MIYRLRQAVRAQVQARELQGCVTGAWAEQGGGGGGGGGGTVLSCLTPRITGCTAALSRDHRSLLLDRAEGKLRHRMIRDVEFR